MEITNRQTLFLILLCGSAQLKAENKLEVIEVTAQKKVESIQTVPISISAINNDELNLLAITEAQDIADLVPNLNTTRAISGVQNYFIRGIGLDDFNLSSVSAVGLYVDDVALHNPMLASFTLNDVSRVEVLRGPQNTLYGKNTTGGAIKFVTTSPEFEPDHNGYAKMSVGSFNRLYLDLASNFLLDDETALRASVYRHTADGQVTSTQPSNPTEFNDTNRYGFKVQMRHQLSSKSELRLALYGGEQDQISAVKTYLEGDPQTGYIDLNDFDLSTNNSSIINPRNDISATGGYIKYKWHEDSLSFSSITSYESVRSERMDDWGAQNNPSGVFQVLTYNSTDTQNIAQEFQLMSDKVEASWLVGAAINIDSGTLGQAAYIDPAGHGRPDDSIDDPGAGPLFDRAALIEVDTQTLSLYGQYSTNLTDSLRLSTGYRWTVQTLSPDVHSAGMMMDSPEKPFPLGTYGWYSLGNQGFDIYQSYVGIEQLNNFAAANGGYAGTANIDKTFSEWGGKLTLDYQATSSVMYYASVSRGFKLGAVNSNPSTVTFHSLLDNIVVPETLITYELGWKSQHLDDRIRLNGAIFNNIWENYQFFLVYNPGNPAALFASLVNLPEAQSSGAEVELDWLISPLLQAKFGVGWLNTEVTDGQLDSSLVSEAQRQDFQDQVTAGNELTNAPEWVINVALEKSIELEESELLFRIQANYMAAHIHMLAGKHTDVWQENFSDKEKTLLSASINYDFGPEREYQLSLWAKNLSDEQYCSERAAIPGTTTETVRLCAQGQPQTIGLTFNYLID